MRRGLWNFVDHRARHLVRGVQNAWTLKHWTSSSNPMEHMLFRFDTPGSLKYWSKHCDSDVGGRSVARLAWHPAGKLIFDGQLSLEIPKATRLVRSGYASVMSPFEQMDLEDFDAIELMAKGDGRTYVFNMAPDVYGMPHVLHQAPLVTSTEWRRYVLPFENFIMTVRGFEGENPAQISITRITSLGFLMAERKNGPFALEVDYIKALNTRLSHGGRYTPARKYRRWFVREEAERRGPEDEPDPDPGNDKPPPRPPW